MIQVIFPLLFALLFISCKNNEIRIEELTSQKLAELRSQYIAEKTVACEKEFFEHVEHVADSILIDLAKKAKYDTLTVPHDTTRPLKPEIQFPTYKKPVKPELEENKK